MHFGCPNVHKTPWQLDFVWNRAMFIDRKNRRSINAMILALDCGGGEGRGSKWGFFLPPSSPYGSKPGTRNAGKCFLLAPDAFPGIPGMCLLPWEVEMGRYGEKERISSLSVFYWLYCCQRSNSKVNGHVRLLSFSPAHFNICIVKEEECPCCWTSKVL